MKSLLITGGARGIGAATARLAARRGWAVCANYRSSAVQAETLVSAIVAEGGKAVAVPGDVAVEADVAAMFDAAASLGPLGGLVNNAGVLAAAAPLADIALDRWQATLATNLTGAFLCAREGVRRMALSKGGQGGAIVNVSSMAAVRGAANRSPITARRRAASTH